jgi:undecaprenyl-diphosphatase
MNAALQAIHTVDLRIYYFLTGFAGNSLFDRFASFEENSNLFKGALFFAIYWFLWFRSDPNQQQRRKAIIHIMIGTLLALAVCRTVADLAPFRIRPMYDPSVQHPTYAFPVSRNMENWSAFPSDTTALFCALAFGLAYLERRLAVPAILYTAVWISLPRMFLGMHHSSDIVVGAGIGVAAVWATLRIKWLESMFTRRVLAWADRAPQIFYAAAFLITFEFATLFDDVRYAVRGLIGAARLVPSGELMRFGVYLLMLLCLGAIIGNLIVIWAGRRSQRALERRHTPVSARPPCYPESEC